jgi:hypothetical protein
VLDELRSGRSEGRELIPKGTFTCARDDLDQIASPPCRHFVRTTDALQFPDHCQPSCNPAILQSCNPVIN